MQIEDTGAGYGWLSIALHWITAFIVLAMLFIGSSISSLLGEERAAMVRLHTSIALSSYVLLWFRIWWRFRRGHPGPTGRQRGIFFTLGKYVHLALLIAIGAMLVSGPLMVWFGGSAIEMFDWFSISSPVASHAGLHGFFFAVHRTAATLIVIGIVMHLAGVYKHAAFNRDGTFTKMMIPSSAGDAGDSPSRTG